MHLPHMLFLESDNKDLLLLCGMLRSQHPFLGGTRKLSGRQALDSCAAPGLQAPCFVESSLSDYLHYHRLPTTHTQTHFSAVLIASSAFCSVSQKLPRHGSSKSSKSCLLGIWGGDKTWEGDGRVISEWKYPAIGDIFTGAVEFCSHFTSVGFLPHWHNKVYSDVIRLSCSTHQTHSKAICMYFRKQRGDHAKVRELT